MEEMDEFDGRKIRNICILVYVDYGKIIFVDYFIVFFGDGELFKLRLVGKVRYMDYFDEEQRCVIIMKSFLIFFGYKDYFFNLLDFFGYMDFCSEVFIVVRFSDGVLVLVDVVEGVYIQIYVVLR